MNQNLFEIFRRARRREIEHRHPVHRRLHVELCIAQVGEHRQVELLEKSLQFGGGAGAWIDTHADDGNEGMFVAHRFLGQQDLEEMACRQHVEERRLNRDEDPIDLFDDRVERFSVQGCRRVENDVRRPFRWFGGLSRLDFPAADLRQDRWPQVQPVARGLLPIDVAEHHPMAAAREMAGQIDGQRGLS